MEIAQLYAAHPGAGGILVGGPDGIVPESVAVAAAAAAAALVRCAREASGASSAARGSSAAAGEEGLEVRYFLRGHGDGVRGALVSSYGGAARTHL